MMRRFPFRRKPEPSPRSDGTAELQRAKEQRTEMDEIAIKHVEVSAKIVERLEANHTAESLRAWFSANQATQPPDPPPRPTVAIRLPWRHA